jgi:hypothetical protein
MLKLKLPDHPLRAIPPAIFLILVAVALWPHYRKFFINEWQERIIHGEPVIFQPYCPDIYGHFKCDDQITATYHKADDGKWCARINKKNQTTDSTLCGLNPYKSDFIPSWHYLELGIQGLQLDYSWKGQVLIPGVGLVGRLTTPENLAARSAHPISMD